MTGPAAALPELDGATVLIRPNGLPGESHFRPDVTSYYVRAAIYENTGAWSQVVKNATLHVLIPEIEYSAEQNVTENSVSVSADVSVTTWVETAVIPFTSPATNTVVVRIPNEAITLIDGTFVTLVRVYVELDDGRISHHNALKNDQVLAGRYDVADALDNVYTPAIAT